MATNKANHDDAMETGLTDEAVLQMTKLDLRGEATPEQSALLRQDAMIERWRSALVSLRIEADDRTKALRVGLLQKQQEFMRRGPGNYAAKQEWFAHKARVEDAILKENAWNSVIQRQLALLKPRLRAMHVQQSKAELAEKTRIQTGPTETTLLRVIQHLAHALTPLASLDYLVTPTARADTHLAAYASVRLKVSDIRAARAAWLEAQAVLGGDRSRKRGLAKTDSSGDDDTDDEDGGTGGDASTDANDTLA